MLRLLRRSVGTLHRRLVYERRIAALAELLSQFVAPGLVLDVGSGDGTLAQQVMNLRPGTSWIGLEIGLRPSVAIPTVLYQGMTIPFADDAFQTVVCVDVLHHSTSREGLLAECIRVAKEVVVVKDHLRSRPFDNALLRVLDWGGNMPHGVPLPYQYFSLASWEAALSKVGAEETHRQLSVPGMYPGLLQKLIGERIQFLSVLSIR